MVGTFKQGAEQLWQGCNSRIFLRTCLVDDSVTCSFMLDVLAYILVSLVTAGFDKHMFIVPSLLCLPVLDIVLDIATIQIALIYKCLMLVRLLEETV